MTDYGVKRKFQAENIVSWKSYETGVKFKHKNNDDEFDFDIEMLKKMIDVYENGKRSIGDESKMPFNYLTYIREQVNALPKGFALHASSYNTDDAHVIHFWNDNGNSWDIYLEKSNK